MDNYMDGYKVARFLLTFLLGWIGSIIINHTYLSPTGFTSRTFSYLFLNILTLGIYGVVASIFNLTFDPDRERNIGYKRYYFDNNYYEDNSNN